MFFEGQIRYLNRIIEEIWSVFCYDLISLMLFMISALRFPPSFMLFSWCASCYLLQKASKLIAKRSSPMDGQLFLIKHFLILREQVRSSYSPTLFFYMTWFLTSLFCFSDCEFWCRIFGNSQGTRFLSCLGW